MSIPNGSPPPGSTRPPAGPVVASKFRSPDVASGMGRTSPVSVAPHPRHPASDSRAIPRVELQIDELMLDGFPASDRHRIAEALQAELTQLLSNGDFSRFRSLEIETLPAGSITANRAGRPGSAGAIGRDAARIIYDALTAPRE